VNEVIFHHYPPSPFSEKVRVAMGIKKLAWRSVEIPRIPPKPDLMPLTGGYRRTPVMQIGADVYCDTQCILRELQRRFPEPTFFASCSAGFRNPPSFPVVQMECRGR
jgi:glutathione S-transferase